MQVRDERTAPIVRHVVLLVAFLLLVGIGIFTVLLPELEDEPSDQQGQTDAPAPGE